MGLSHRKHYKACEMERIVNKKDKRIKIILVICNFTLILATVIAAATYSRHIRKGQEEANTVDFIRMVESMKQVSQNYLDSERGYAKNWAAYITQQGMTLEEALDFLRSINTNKARFAHIVDMDTFDAYSSFYSKGEEEIDAYVKYKEQNVEAELPFAKIMYNMFNGTGEEFEVLGKYRVPETKANALGIGARVTLQTDSGTKDYLLLRIIPTEEIRQSWVFPLEYKSAEVGIITNSGDYVIQSASMKSSNFREYIRGYNFQNDYNQVDVLMKQLETTDNGVLEYKNFRGEDCLWYYSSFGTDSALDILGVINEDELKSTIEAWYIAFLVCGILIVLVLIDGMYLVSMNRKLRLAAEISQQASKAKTQFLSAMSHDIRTPLNAVMGMMEIAQKNADNPEYVTECLDKGIHSGKQLLTLINDVLDISKIESGKVILNLERVDLQEILHDLTEMQAQAIAQKGIELECDFNRLPHRYVRADRMRLNQIYVNLFTNAVKYTENGGKITLRLYEEQISDHPENTRLVFYVEDTGIGMTEEFQKHMYSIFEREIKTQVNSTQ